MSKNCKKIITSTIHMLGKILKALYRVGQECSDIINDRTPKLAYLDG